MTTPNQCQIEIVLPGGRATLRLSLGGEFSGGKIVEKAPDFLGVIVGTGETAEGYTLDNWLAGMSSGALFAFRKLGLPRRGVALHRVEGELPAAGIPALADAVAMAVAKLTGRAPMPMETDAGSITCRIVHESESVEPSAPKAPMRVAG